MEQRSPEWFAARKGKITGSRVGGILGVNPYKSRDDVMREMVREWFDAPSEFTGNEATDWGEKMEPVALAFYREQLVDDSVLGVKDVGFIPHPTLDFIGASPDGEFIMAQGINWRGGLEIKCPFPPYHARRGYIPYGIEDKPSYAAQMQLVMECCDWQLMDFLCYFNEDNYKLDTLERDPVWWADAEPKLHAFHQEFLSIIGSKKKAAPYLKDGKPADPVIDDPRVSELSTLFFRIAANKERMKPTVDRFEELKKELAKEFGIGTNDGVRFYEQSKKGGIDYAALHDAIDLPAILKDQGMTLEQFRKPGTTAIVVEAAK